MPKYVNEIEMKLIQLNVGGCCSKLRDVEFRDEKIITNL
jgi:hypothetical protein